MLAAVGAGLSAGCSEPSAAPVADDMATARRAILVALPLAATHGAFDKSVVVQCRTASRGGYVVSFGRETSRVIASEGRIPIKTLVEIPVTRRMLEATPRASTPKSKRDRLAKAAAAACSYLFGKSHLDLEFNIGVDETAGGYDVGIWRIPYSPGGNVGIRLTRAYKVRSVFPGA